MTRSNTFDRVRTRGTVSKIQHCWMFEHRRRRTQSVDGVDLRTSSACVRRRVQSITCTYQQVAYLVNEFSNHAIPLAVQSDRRAVFVVVDQLDDVVELQHLGNLLQQVDAETLKACVSRVNEARFVRTKHDVRVFLYNSYHVNDLLKEFRPFFINLNLHSHLWMYFYVENI